MGNMWRLRQEEANTIYIKEHLTMDEVLHDMFDLIGYAHNGCLHQLHKMYGDITCSGRQFVDTYTFVFEFNGEKVTYIYEREVEENEKDAVIGSS